MLAKYKIWREVIMEKVVSNSWMMRILNQLTTHKDRDSIIWQVQTPSTKNQCINQIWTTEVSALSIMINFPYKAFNKMMLVATTTWSLMILEFNNINRMTLY